MNISTDKLNKKHITTILLIFIIVFYLINNYIWIKINDIQYIYQGSFAWHFKQVISVYDALKIFDISELWHIIKFNDYAPLNLFFTAFILLITGKSYLTLILIQNTFYFSILIIFTYKLSRLFTTRKTALSASVLLALYPVIYGISRSFSMDFATAAAVVFSIYCLVKTKHFSSRKWSIIFAFSATAGMMIKYPFAAFTIGPFILYLIYLIKHHKQAQLVNLSISIFIVGLICSPHYLNSTFFHKILTDPISETRGIWYTMLNLKTYTLGISQFQLSPLFFILLLFAIPKFLRHKNHQMKLILISWILIPWFILTIIPHRKETEYIIPYLPAIAILSAIGINMYKTKFINIIFYSLLFLGFGQYFIFSFDNLNLPLNHLTYTISKNLEISYFEMEPNILSKKIEERVYDNIYTKLQELQSRKKQTLNIVKIIEKRPFQQAFYNLNILDNLLWFINSDIKIDEIAFTDILEKPEKAKNNIILISSADADLHAPDYYDTIVDSYKIWIQDYPQYKKHSKDLEALNLNNHLQNIRDIYKQTSVIKGHDIAVKLYFTKDNN